MDEFRRGIERFQQDLERKIERIHGQHSITEILNPAFMRANTPYSTFEEMCAAVGVTTAEQFTAMPDDEWEAHVRATTSFASWEQMQQVAGQEWARRQLTDDL